MNEQEYRNVKVVNGKDLENILIKYAVCGLSVVIIINSSPFYSKYLEDHNNHLPETKYPVRILPAGDIEFGTAIAVGVVQTRLHFLLLLDDYHPVANS